MRKLTELQETTLANIKSDVANNEDMSIRQCAARNYVSIGFLSKLANRVGYHGYSEMIFSLRSHEIGIGDVTSSETNYEDYIKTYILNYSKKLHDSFEKLIVDSKDGVIYCNGIGYSTIAVDYINRKANKNGYKVNYTESVNEIISDNNLKLIISISSSGESEDVVRVLETCKNSNIPSIVFTRNINGRCARMADVVILVNKIKNENLYKVDSFVGNTILSFELLVSNIMKKK